MKWLDFLSMPTISESCWMWRLMNSTSSGIVLDIFSLLTPANSWRSPSTSILCCARAADDDMLLRVDQICICRIKLILVILIIIYQLQIIQLTILYYRSYKIANTATPTNENHLEDFYTNYMCNKVYTWKFVRIRIDTIVFWTSLCSLIKNHK